MQTIHKFPITIEDNFSILMPEHAQILCVQVQREIPCIWASVETNNVTVKRNFKMAGTGHKVLIDQSQALKYIGTFQLYNGDLVYHVFEVIEC